MKMFLARFGFAGILVIGSSGAPVAPLDYFASPKAAHPVASVAYTEKTRATRIVDADYRLTDQERTVIAYLRLKAETERDAHPR